MKGTVEELKKSSQKDQEDAVSPGATAAKVDEASGEASAGPQAQGKASDDRQQRASATAGTGEGSPGAQEQGQTGGSGESQTAGAAGSTASLMSRLRSMAEVARKEVRAVVNDMVLTPHSVRGLSACRMNPLMHNTLGGGDSAIVRPVHLQAMHALLQLDHSDSGCYQGVKHAWLALACKCDLHLTSDSHFRILRQRTNGIKHCLLVEQALSCDQVAAAILPEAPLSSATRAYSDDLRASAPPPSADSAVAVVQPTRWQKQWGEWQSKVRCCPFSMMYSCYVEVYMLSFVHILLQICTVVGSREVGFCPGMCCAVDGIHFCQVL